MEKIKLQDVLDKTNDILDNIYDYDLVRSYQIKAIVEALVDVINKKLEEIEHLSVKATE